MAAKHIPAMRSISKMGNPTRLEYLTPIRASSQSMDHKDNVFKQLGLFALRKKIEDAVVRAEMLAPMALELEEERRIQREEKMRSYNLWDDPAKSNEMLSKLADSTKLIDSLKDLAYKIEEAKLITELAETDAVNYRLFKQAYNASVDATKLLDQYEMSKLLTGMYDMHGASLVIEAGDNGIYSEIWASRILTMYTKWAEKLGHKPRTIDQRPSESNGIKSATVEFEFEHAYGFLTGEKGVHRLTDSVDSPTPNKGNVVIVDVVPLFLNAVPELEIDETEVIVLYEESPSGSAVLVRHVPTGICVESSGERNKFANKMKGLNRLKAKLLVAISEQGISRTGEIDRELIMDVRKVETRRYALAPYKQVHDVRTGVQISDINSVLNGNIDLFIAAHVNLRYGSVKN